ncbi:MAG: tetratricopeptide repeat protein [Bacteriovoracaceae bacterium]|nr:tetratricopeptide repeat protein [Bacteroidota bacterium]
MKLFTITIALLLAGCSPGDEELWLKVEQAKENNNWDSTMSVSQRILDEYPDGRFAGWARFALAESFRFKNQPREALDHYKIFIDTYPDLQPAAISLFLVGYIYGNNLQVYDSAKFYYEEFLKKYPHHDLVPSVKLELETLGKSPHEALMETTEKNRSMAKQ